jgi:hypothetical protein
MVSDISVTDTTIHKEKRSDRVQPDPAWHDKNPCCPIHALRPGLPIDQFHSDPCTTHEAVWRSLDLHPPPPPHGPMSSNGSLYARLDPVAVSVRWDFYQRWVTGISHARHYSEKIVLAGY